MDEMSRVRQSHARLNELQQKLRWMKFTHEFRVLYLNTQIAEERQRLLNESATVFSHYGIHPVVVDVKI